MRRPTAVLVLSATRARSPRRPDHRSAARRSAPRGTAAVDPGPDRRRRRGLAGRAGAPGPRGRGRRAPRRRRPRGVHGTAPPPRRTASSASPGTPTSRPRSSPTTSWSPCARAAAGPGSPGPRSAPTPGDGPAEGEGAVPVEGAEGVGTPARVGTSPYFAGPSDGIQVRVDTVTGALPVGLRVDLVDPGSSDADTHLVASAPLAGAGRRGQAVRDQPRPSGAPTSRCATAPPPTSPASGSRSCTTRPRRTRYTKDQAAAAVRSIYAYDTNSLGWSDIAYNVLVDKYGQVFEGRAGGLDKAVRSGATGGFNAESWSVSALGNYETEAPSSTLVVARSPRSSRGSSASSTATRWARPR